MPRSPEAAPAAPPAASVIVPLYDDTDKSVVSVSVLWITVEKTRAVLPVPLTYDAVSPLDRVRVGVPDTTTVSSQVTVIESVSPIPYAPFVAATDERSGASPSTDTVPTSTVPVAAAAPPAASAIVPVYPVTERSAESV